MAKIVKAQWNNINGGTDRTDIYPITSDRAVYNADNKTMREIIRVRGVVNISTYFTADGTPEKLTLETALKKITEENRCPGFLATILTTEDEWWTFRYNAYTIDDDSWNNTDNWSPFHAGWLKTDTASEDPETPLHLEWVVKNYIYTLKGWIDSVSTERNGYFTADDYKKFLEALDNIKSLQERMAAAEATIQNHETRLTNAETTIQNHETRLTAAESTIQNHETRLTAAESTIQNHETRLTNAEATIVNHENRLNSAEGRLDDAESWIDSTANRLNDDESRIATNEDSIAYINNDLITVHGQVKTLQDSVVTINSDISSINLELSALQDSVSNLKITTVVSELPTTNIDTNTMYLVPDPNAEEGNQFVEWIYVNNKWEKVGEVKLDTDLSEYTKTKDLGNYIDTLGYAKTSDTVTSVAAQNTSSSDVSDCLNITPTSATKGDVVINVGLVSANLKNWINNNLSSTGMTDEQTKELTELWEHYNAGDFTKTYISSITCTGDEYITFVVNSSDSSVNITGTINYEKLGPEIGPFVFPYIDNSVSNPTDIYFTSNQLITGSVSGTASMNFHATNGVPGVEVQIILQAGSSGATISIIGNSAIITDECSTITIDANKYAEINAIFDGSKIYIRSSGN